MIVYIPCNLWNMRMWIEASWCRHIRNDMRNWEGGGGYCWLLVYFVVVLASIGTTSFWSSTPSRPVGAVKVDVRGKRLERRNDEQESLLFCASKRGLHRVVAKLVELDVSLGSRDCYNVTPLHAAARFGLQTPSSTSPSPTTVCNSWLLMVLSNQM